MSLDESQADLQPLPIPAVWTSTEGRVWAAADSIDSAPFDYGEIHDLAPVGSGFVAVGQVWDANKQSRPAVWTSPEGRRWTLRPADPLGRIGERERVLMQVVAGQGGLVAIGQIRPYEGDWPGPILTWWSQDGLVWERASFAPDSFAPGSRFSSLVAFGSGFVMVGTGEAGSGVAWISANGRTWSEPTTLPTRPKTGSSFVNGLATDGSILVAVGDNVIFGPGTSPATGDTSIWMSSNGTDWVQVPPETLRGAVVLDQVAADSVVQLNETWVVLGSSHSHSEDVSVGLVWVGQ